MADDFRLGAGWKVYFGTAAAAPTTPADETQGAYTELGEIPEDIVIQRSRSVIERRNRDNPNDRYVHAGERTESVTFPVDVDVDGNQALTDILAAFASDTDGQGASGTHGYLNITDAVSGNPQYYGEAMPSDVPETIPRQGIIRINVTMQWNGDLTRANHS